MKVVSMALSAAVVAYFGLSAENAQGLTAPDDSPTHPPHVALRDDSPTHPPHLALRDDSPTHPPHLALRDDSPTHPPHLV